MPRSAAVYARISRDPGQTFAGVQRQVNNALDDIKARPDIELNTEIEGSPVDRRHPERGHWPPGVLVDDDISAAKGSRRKRPEYERLMTYASGGDIETIVASEQDRLWRDLAEAAEGMAELKDSGVKLLFLKTGYQLDLSDDFNAAVVGLMAVFASWFTGNIKAKQRLATKEAAEAGAYHGARPFGFTLAHLNNPDDLGAGTHEPLKSNAGDRVKCPGCSGRASNKARTIIPDATEAAAVRDAYQMVAAGITPYAVCQYLDGYEIDGPDGTRRVRAAIKTANGKTWEQVGVQGLLVVLRAKRNTGVREWSAKWDGGKRPAGTLIKGNWPAIVSDELFDAVQAQLDQRRKARPGGNLPAHLLTGFAFGGLCGHRLRIHKIGGKRRYACGSWRSGGQCVSFEADAAEAEVERYLYKWLAKNTMLAKALEHTGDTDLQKLYDRRTKLTGQREKIDDDLTDGVYDLPDGTRDVERYRRLRGRKDEQLTDVGREIDTRLASVGTRGKSFPTGTAFRTEWRNADLDGKRAIILRFIDKVVIYPASAGNKPDPRLVQIHPGAWATGIDAAQPLPAPDPVSFTSRGKIAAYLREHAGEWFSREAIATAAGVSPTATDKNLKMLGAAGEIAREWTRRDGQRACYLYSAASGESWGPRTRKGEPGAREKVRSFMEASPRGWFTAAEIGAGSDAGDAPHISRTLTELIAAGFIQRRRAPLPRKHVRYEYSVNGR